MGAVVPVITECMSYQRQNRGLLNGGKLWFS